MAKLIQVLEQVGGQPVNTFMKSFNVKDGTTASIKAGYLVIADGSNPGYVKAAADACDTDSTIVGVANSDSTETATAVGSVTVECAPVLVVAVKAKTPANLTTAMKLTNRYILDVTSGNYTLDQGGTTKGLFRLLDWDDTTNGNCVASIQCSLF